LGNTTFQKEGEKKQDPSMEGDDFTKRKESRQGKRVKKKTDRKSLEKRGKKKGGTGAPKEEGGGVGERGYRG